MVTPKKNATAPQSLQQNLQDSLTDISESLKVLDARLSHMEASPSGSHGTNGGNGNLLPGLQGQGLVNVQGIPGAVPAAQGPGRFNTCAMCGGRDYRGTVSLETGEYIASGMTPSFLKNLPAVQVIINGNRSTVSGAWLHSEVTTRRPLPGGMRERATSLPGFLCGEPTSAHQTVSLVAPLLRRATEDEEVVQRVTRVANWANNLNPADVVSHATKDAAGGIPRLIGSVQNLARFAAEVDGQARPQARQSRTRVGSRTSR